MKLIIARDMKAELLEIDCRFKNEMSPWWPDLINYINELEHDHTWQTLPAIILSIYKYFEIETSRSLSLATVFKTVYFVNYIHGLVKDDIEGQLYNQEFQFSILIGDYISGRTLKMLLDCNSEMLLDSFSAMTVEINEGMVLQHRLALDALAKIQKTKVPLYVYAFVTAARLAKCDSEIQQIGSQLGFNLGTAIELSALDQPNTDIKSFIAAGEELFSRLNHAKPVSKSWLELVIAELGQFYCNPQKLAVM